MWLGVAMTLVTLRALDPCQKSASLALVLTEPGPVENLAIRELPVPEPLPGWVRIAVRAFGLNRSELHTRLGLAEDVTFPRVLGIEAVGVVDVAAGTDLQAGQQVATLMGGMGRTFDGGYAEYTVVPRRQVVPFRSTLPWNILGAVPETLQTAYGSLTVGLDLQRGQSLLIRGGTSSVGLAAAAIAKDLGAAVLEECLAIKVRTVEGRAPREPAQATRRRYRLAQTAHRTPTPATRPSAWSLPPTR